MNNELLNMFLSLDGDAYVRSLLLAAIRDNAQSDGAETFNFNVFDVTLDYGRKKAMVVNILTVGEDATIELGIEEFAATLK